MINLLNNIKIKLKDTKLLVVIGLILVFISILPAVVQAAEASLFFSPSDGIYHIGSTFLVKVKVNSDGTPINAAQSKVLFPQEILEVKSISKAGSIFTLWPEEPVFSNSEGEVSFKGGIPAPGFTGTDNILTINFQAKKTGQAKVSFSEAKVLAADGRGTNILKLTQEAIFSITEIYPEVSRAPVPPHPFDVIVDNEGDPTNPRPFLYFETKDDLSGISHYEIKIGQGDIFSLVMVETNPLRLFHQAPGSYEILVKAIDQAGNFEESSALLNIESIPIPEISVYPRIHTAGEEEFYIAGTAPADLTIMIFFKRDQELVKTWEVKSDKNGDWSFYTSDLFESGNYLISTRSKDQRGAISDSSPEYQIEVILAGISIGPLMVTYRALFPILIILIVLITGIVICLILFKVRKIKKEIQEAAESLKNTFNEVKRKAIEKIEYLDSKPGLNPDEEKLRDELVNILEKSEEVIAKEIEDIREELK